LMKSGRFVISKIDRTIDVTDDFLVAEGEYEPKLAKHSQVLLEAPRG